MFESLFDIPLLIVGPAIIVLLCLFAIAGLLWSAVGIRSDPHPLIYDQLMKQ